MASAAGVGGGPNNGGGGNAGGQQQQQQHPPPPEDSIEFLQVFYLFSWPVFTAVKIDSNVWW